VEVILAVLVGVLFSGGIYMLLRRSLPKLVIGLILLSNAANLLIFTASGLTRGRAPLIRLGEETLRGTEADPLPQALVLTAIVISFGLLAFTLVLLKLVARTTAAGDADELRSTEE
jgi:multicomponent Na+:H+ antiporter subunit C